MKSRSFIRIGFALAIAACGFSIASAQEDDRARAQVFTRNLSGGAQMVFSWDSHEKVPFTTERDGDEVVLHFDKPVALRWGSSLEAVNSYVKEVETTDGGNTVILTLNRPAKAQELHHLDREEADNDENGLALVPTGTTREPVATMDSSDTLPTPTLKQRRTRKATAHARHKPARKIHEAKAKPAAQPPEADAEHLATLAPAAGTPTTATAAPAPHVAEAPAITPAVNAALAASSTPAAPMATAPALPMAAPAPVVADHANIPLPFAQGEPFAVFTLRKNLWIVAQHYDAPSADSLRKAGANFVKDAKVTNDPKTTVITLALADGVSASVEKGGPDGLRLRLEPGATRLSRTFIPAIASTPAGTNPSAIEIPTGKSVQMLSVRDPATGTGLSIIPSEETGAGIAPGRSFVEFNLLPSAQGVAVESLSDGLSVSMQKGTVEITATGGLNISPEAAQQMKDTEADIALSRLPPTLFPYARWKLEDEKDYVPAQIKLIDEISSGAPDAANKARLKLLGLFLGEGMFPEALGMSDDILRSSLKFYRQNKVSALRGAAYLFTYRIHEARRDFDAPELKDEPEAQFLLALCDNLLGNPDKTFDFNANYERYISHYPPVFIQKLAIMAADRSINRKEYDAANTIFETLKRDSYDEPVKKYIDYMRAKILSETHSETEAAQIWDEQAKDLSDPLIRARAEFSLVNMLLRNEKISHEEAIKRLEKLRIVWRGDSLELEVLTLLGNLYLEEKQYANALHTMRDIVLYYPEVPEALTTARQMEATFVTLYNKDGASSMPPLEALALFYEFRDLVPLGAPGDLMIRNLADRLVSIDLLDRAALLLDHQIKNRLSGEERSRVGAQLANIYLLNRQPDKALDTLKTTGYGELPPELQLQRLRLTARALAQQGFAAKAIDVISSDNSNEGEALRLSIYWDNKDWANIVTMAEDILGNRNDPSAPLTVPESEVLLKLATAYVYQHDAGQLQYLRDYFTPLMKDNPNKDSFLFITSESGSVDYDNLANLDQDIGAVKSFLDKAQDRPGKNGLSNPAAN